MEASTRSRNLHPFPARMAPEIALAKIRELTTAGAVVLDPMCGSGTVPRLALQQGRRAIACDLDPLAVMMTRTACRTGLSTNLAARAQDLIIDAKRLRNPSPSWIQRDSDTQDFVNYWFASQQRDQLGRLARVLAERPTSDDPLRIALSRIIITKDGGASLARDTSHSRPHRVRDDNPFDVYAGFERAATRIEAAVGEVPRDRTANIRTVDARSLGFVERSSVDLVVTSPPYLNAIDYLRGHRMSLVWLGWTIGDLRQVRGGSIGSERGIKRPTASIAQLAHEAIPCVDKLSSRHRGLVWRFALDVDHLCRSFARVTKPGGYLVFVVADSQLKGVPIPNSALCRIAAERSGFRLDDVTTRELPAQHRYLPPPLTSVGTMASRMGVEVIMTLSRCIQSAIC